MHPRLRKWLDMESEPTPQPFPAPVFIAGCMRSGTSMLVDKLTQHPQLLKIGVELNDIWTAIGDAPCRAPCAYRNETHARPQAGYNMATYFAEFIRKSRSWRRHLMRAKNYFREDKGSIFLDWDNVVPVNKSPHLTNKLRYVHSLFPEGKILFIIRGIEGHSASMKIHFDRNYEETGLISYLPKNPKGCYSRVPQRARQPEGVFPERCYPGDFSIIPEMWIRLNQLALEDMSELPNGSYKVIVYEELVQNWDVVLRDIFDFLDLEPKHESSTKKIIQSQMKIINTTTKGSPLEKWRRTLTKEEINEMYEVIERHQASYDAIMEQVEGYRILTRAKS